MAPSTDDVVEAAPAGAVEAAPAGAVEAAPAGAVEEVLRPYPTKAFQTPLRIPTENPTNSNKTKIPTEKLAIPTEGRIPTQALEQTKII